MHVALYPAKLIVIFFLNTPGPYYPVDPWLWENGVYRDGHLYTQRSLNSAGASREQI